MPQAIIRVDYLIARKPRHEDDINERLRMLKTIRKHYGAYITKSEFSKSTDPIMDDDGISVVTDAEDPKNYRITFAMTKSSTDDDKSAYGELVDKAEECRSMLEGEFSSIIVGNISSQLGRHPTGRS